LSSLKRITQHSLDYSEMDSLPIEEEGHGRETGMGRSVL
jgi:hypothetical protein